MFLREWRRYQGFSQHAMADALGVSVAHLARVEAGREALKQGFLRKASRFLSVPTWAILSRDPNAPPEGGDTPPTAPAAAKRA